MSGFALYLAEATEVVTLVMNGKGRYQIYCADAECVEEIEDEPIDRIHVKHSVLLTRINEIFGQVPNPIKEIPLLECEQILPSPDPLPGESFLSFDQLSVVTVTIGAYATGEVLDLSALFSLLPLNLNDVPGTISFAGYEDIYRGRIANTKKINKNFCDAISMRMRLSRKEIFVKLYAKRAHICGIQAPVDIEDFCKIMQSILNYLEELLENIRQHPDVYIATAQQFLESCRGDYFIGEEISSTGEITQVEDYFLRADYIDTDNMLINYFQSLCLDSNCVNLFSHNDLRRKLTAIYNYALENKKFSSITEFSQIEVYMFNRNFKLPFPIDRDKICALFDGKYGFFAMMEPTKNKINITHRTNKINGIDRTTKRGHILMHHFSISCKGSVSLSDEGGIEARDIYYKFIRLVMRYRDKIELNLSVVKNEVDSFINFINSA